MYAYIYQLTGKNLNLLWRFSTGSESYCGHKNSYLDDKELVFELFGNCGIKGSEYKQFNKPLGDLDITEYSLVRVAWDGCRFRQKSRQVLPFPYKNYQDYYQAIGAY